MSRSVGEFALVGHLGEGSFATVSLGLWWCGARRLWSVFTKCRRRVSFLVHGIGRAEYGDVDFFFSKTVHSRLSVL